MGASTKSKYVSFLPAFIVASVGLQSLLALGVFLNLFYSARQKVPTLVETADGSSIQVQPIGKDERSPAAIQQFVGATLIRMFDWRGTLLPGDGQTTHTPQQDPGVAVGENLKITTASWQAGFAFSDGFRQPFLKQISQLTPASIFNQRPGEGSQALLVVRHIGEPKQLSNPGRWKVPVVANLLVFQNGDNLGKAIPFNKDVFVRSIDTPPLPKHSSPLSIVIYNARKSQLEIYAMQDLNLGH